MQINNTCLKVDTAIRSGRGTKSLYVRISPMRIAAINVSVCFDEKPPTTNITDRISIDNER